MQTNLINKIGLWVATIIDSFILIPIRNENGVSQMAPVRIKPRCKRNVAVHCTFTLLTLTEPILMFLTVTIMY